MKTRLTQPARRGGGEPTIGLINVVFLLLVFFLIAGSLAPSPDPALRLLRIADAATQAPADALVLMADGAVTHQGLPVDPAAHVAALPDTALVRVMPDRAAPAARLVELADQLIAAGAQRVVLLGEPAP
ncbi:MAG: ExbD/TolR family protein [Pararhodobacter sp.]